MLPHRPMPGETERERSGGFPTAELRCDNLATKAGRLEIASFYHS